MQKKTFGVVNNRKLWMSSQVVRVVKVVKLVQ